MLAALDQVIDLDAFFTFWAAEVLVAHWDGYAGNTNNFFVYLHSDGRLRFVPWGVDGTFVDLTSRAGPQSSPTSVLAVGALAHRLYALPAGRARYVAELRRLLADAWHESAMLGDIDAWDALTRSSREPGSADAGAAAVAELKAYVQARRAAIEAELASPPDWPDPLRAELCMHDGGTVTGSFSTTWDTLAIDNLFQTGTGTLGVVSTSLPPLTFAEIGSKAGVDAVGAPGVTQYVLAAHVVNAGYVIILFQSTEPVAPGPLAIDHLTTDGFVYYLQQPDPAQFIGILGDGDLVLEQADATPGSPVKGSFALTLFML
ncbi:MAG: CotH kinase family protein [Myxococcota bacterium]